MSKIIQIDKRHFSIDGTVPLYIGDDWSLKVTFFERKLNYLDPQEMTGISASAFFPSSGTAIAASVTFNCAADGEATITMPAAQTVLVSPNSSGIDIYALAVASGLIQTYTTENLPIEVLNRAY